MKILKVFCLLVFASLLISHAYADNPNKNRRYEIVPMVRGDVGTMYKIDTWTGDTWVNVPIQIELSNGGLQLIACWQKLPDKNEVIKNINKYMKDIGKGYRLVPAKGPIEFADGTIGLRDGSRIKKQKDGTWVTVK